MNYKLELDGKTIEGTVDTAFCRSYEKGLLRRVCITAHNHKAVYESIMAVLADMSLESRKDGLSLNYQNWFKSTLPLVQAIRTADTESKLLNLVYVQGANKKYRLCDCWLYLAGSTKNFVNYALIDMGYLKSTNEREQAKKKVLQKA